MISAINNFSRKYFQFTENINRYILFSFFIFLCFLVWVEPFAFFRGDDWRFIIDYANGKTFKEYALVGHGPHVIPLFKFFYNVELMIFGKNAICFQVLTVLIFSFIPFVFYLIQKQIISAGNAGIIVLVSTLLSLHPNFADIIYWIFQQGVILQILFQLLAILYYFKFLKDNDKKLLFPFFLFLIIQNYFFGNGVLFPLLFIGDYLLLRLIFSTKKFSYAFFGVLLFLEIAFIIIQTKLSLQTVEIKILLSHSKEIVSSFFNLIHVSITRFFFIRQIGGIISEAIAGILFFAISVLAYKNNKRYFIFNLLYLIVVSIAIPIGRFEHLHNASAFQVHYYYSILLFPPIAFLLFLAVTNLSVESKNYFLIISLIFLIGYLFVNIQAKKIFTYKDFKNKEDILNAVRYSKKNYYPFEDKMFSCGISFRQSLPHNQEIQKSIQKSNYFNYDSSVVGLIGKDCFKTFLIYNNKMINSYIYLEKKSMFDLNINYENKE